MDETRLWDDRGLKLIRAAIGKESGYLEKSVRSLFEYIFQEDVSHWEYQLVNNRYYLMYPSIDKNYHYNIVPNTIPPVRNEAAGAIACLATYRALDEHPVFQKQFNGIYQHYQNSSAKGYIEKAVDSFEYFPRSVNRNEAIQSARYG